MNSRSQNFLFLDLQESTTLSEKQPRKGKDLGVLLYFANLTSPNILPPLQKKNEDVIWVRIGTELTGDDIYLGTIYYSPTGNKENVSNKFMKLSDEILHFQQKGKIILQGDLNAHTGEKADIIQPDKFEQDAEVGENYEMPSRNSEDRSKTNERGEQLIELCRAHNLVILNGRKTGDPWGKVTSFQWNGIALVDYVITSIGIFNNIKRFKVGDYCPWVSDHCPLLFEVSLIKHMKSPDEEKLDDLPKSFHLTQEDRQKFLNLMKSPEGLQKLNNLYTDNSSPQEVATKITELLLETCDLAGIKPKKLKRERNSSQP